MTPREHPAWAASVAEARRQWPGLPEIAFEKAGGLPFATMTEIKVMNAEIAALLARTWWLLNDSFIAKEEMYTGAEHLVVAQMRMDGNPLPAPAIDADVDRFRRLVPSVPPS